MNYTHQCYNSLIETNTYVAKGYTKYVSYRDKKGPVERILTSNV